MLKGLSKLSFPNLRLALLVFAGTISWSLVMVKSGLVYDFGAGFWGANGHDGIWHVALINSLARGSFEMPTFAGAALQNYHIGFDLFVALLHKLTGVSVITLYFQILPPLMALSIGLLVYWLTRNLWSVFFVYFGGDLAWMFGRGESTFWAQQSISTLINPPFALSLIFIILGLILLQKRKLFLAILCFGVLTQIKIYAAVLVLAGLFTSGIFEYFKSKNLFLLKIFLGSLTLNFLLFLSSNKLTTNLLILQPFWFLDTLFLSDRFGWPRFESALVNYRLAGNWAKLLPAYVVAFAIFIIGNMGTRLFFLKNYRKITYLEIFVTTIILAGTAIPMLFVQQGTPWNTIQFFYYSLIFSGILAGLAMQNSKKIIGVVIILLTIPTSILTLTNNYLPARPPAKISNYELDALNFLNKQPTGVVLTYPVTREDVPPPRPLYRYESTAYVSAYANKPVFLEDEVNLNITGFNFRARREEVENFLNSTDQEFVRKFLQENNIGYVYWIKPQRAKLGETQLGIEKIFENQEVDIYKVLK